jgi:hypothetical protein
MTWLPATPTRRRGAIEDRADYSNATRGNIDVDLLLHGETL